MSANKMTIKEAEDKAKEAIRVLSSVIANHDCREEKCTQFYEGECEAKLIGGPVLYYP